MTIDERSSWSGWSNGGRRTRTRRRRRRRGGLLFGSLLFLIPIFLRGALVVLFLLVAVCVELGGKVAFPPLTSRSSSGTARGGLCVRASSRGRPIRSRDPPHPCQRVRIGLLLASIVADLTGELLSFQLLVLLLDGSLCFAALFSRVNRDGSVA
jgi:hypothetical protein